MSEPLLNIQNLHVTFTGRRTSHAVNGIDLCLNKGESLALLGESGSGKSVTLRSIMGLHPKNKTTITGQMDCLGSDLLRLPLPEFNRLRGSSLSMIFQEPGLAFDPVYSIGQQISETLQTHKGLSKKQAWERGIELLELVQIPQASRRMDNYPHELSGGMRQRAMIAMAVACEPALLLADEPTTALDATVQIQVLLMLRRLQTNNGMSMIFVTHDMGAAVEVADRIAVMYAGRIVEHGPTEQIVRNPRHPYTQGLLASTVTHEHRGKPLPAIPGQPPLLQTAPTHCAFAPRCAHATQQCASELPPMQGDKAAGSGVACWHTLVPVTEVNQVVEVPA